MRFSCPKEALLSAGTTQPQLENCRARCHIVLEPLNWSLRLVVPLGFGFLGERRESSAVSSGLQALAATEMSALAYRKVRL